MLFTIGKVKDGAIQIEGASLPEGTTVTILAREEEDSLEVTAEEEAMLLAAIAEADSGNVTPVEDVLQRLRAK